MAKRKSWGKPESVFWGGREWRRYPEAPQRTGRVYFSSRGEYLHRAKWVAAYGPIPKKHHIHHVDGDPLNNELENLECVLGSEHLAEHARAPERVAAARRNLDAARNAATLWHGSPAGLRWHAEHGRIAMAKRKMVSHRCVVCKRKYRTRAKQSNVCGPNCFARRRRASGLDDIELTCPECGEKFMRNRYSKPGCCSRSCAARKANRERGQRLQHHRSE